MQVWRRKNVCSHDETKAAWALVNLNERRWNTPPKLENRSAC